MLNFRHFTTLPFTSTLVNILVNTARRSESFASFGASPRGSGEEEAFHAGARHDRGPGPKRTAGERPQRGPKTQQAKSDAPSNETQTRPPRACLLGNFMNPTCVPRRRLGCLVVVRSRVRAPPSTCPSCVCSPSGHGIHTWQRAARRDASWLRPSDGDIGHCGTSSDGHPRAGGARAW